MAQTDEGRWLEGLREEDALSHMEDLKNDAVDRLRLMRFTLTERIDRLMDEIDRGGLSHQSLSRIEGRIYAYTDTLALIGPDYDLPDDDGSPF